MVASRRRPKGGHGGSFGLSILAMCLLPTQIGYQDLVALMARQPEASERARARMLASPFGTIHAATFSFPRPLGTLIPEPPSLQLVSAQAGDLDTTASVGVGLPLLRPHVEFPLVNRRLKGDLLVARPREEPPAEGTRDLTPGRVKTVSFPRPADRPAPDDVALPVVGQALAAGRASGDPGQAPAEGKPSAATAAAPDLASSRSEADVVSAALSRNRDPGQTEATSEPTPAEGTASYQLAALPPQNRPQPQQSSPLQAPIDDSSSAERLGRFYFGGNPLGAGEGTIQPWPMDEEPLLHGVPSADPDFKHSAVSTAAREPEPTPQAGESVAAKGEVTGAGKRPRTPAERLGLSGKARAKAEKCLAEAVYFESRGEPKRGQIAVAQVVMNRVFSGFYPTNVCGVVYQNAHRKLACQFTFACDNVPDVVTEPRLWEQAKDIARDMLDGKLWLPEIGHSTHYHAYWVHPSWVNEMRRMHKIGVHSFYRPRAWGDGSENPPLNQSQAPPPPSSTNGKAAM